MACLGRDANVIEDAITLSAVSKLVMDTASKVSSSVILRQR